jgi:murein DD-endopeptidase MepM/ murein hydrolase activator NlpD
MLRKYFFHLVTGISLALVSGIAKPAQAETFSINNFAMDTGNHINRINGGGPQMKQWALDSNHPNQNFDQVPGYRGGMLLKHRSTGLCLNAYRASAGSLINTFNCNPNDPEQNFVMHDHGNSYRMINLAYTNLCVDSTPQPENRQRVILWHCLPNGQNHYQRWLSRSSAASNSVSANKSYLPFDPGTTLTVSRGYGNNTHGGIVRGYPAWWFSASTYAVDFARDPARPYTGARAVRAGKVLSAGWANLDWDNGFGQLVKIQYRDGKIGYYAHLDWISVKAGDEVSGGQHIGTIGNTGNSTGPHLHYEERNKEFGGTSSPLNFNEGNFNFNNSQQFPVTSQNPDGRR